MFSQLSKEFDFNVWEAIELSNKHPRVNIHAPGPGVGGHCIPIDPYFLLDGTENSSLIKESLEIMRRADAAGRGADVGNKKGQAAAGVLNTHALGVEIAVVNGSEIHVYHNPAPNPRPNQPRLWEQNHYRRSKMTWNYYSP